MTLEKMETIEKRFRFYQKSIFFSDFNIEQQKKFNNQIQPVSSSKKLPFSDRLYNPLYSPNNCMTRPEKNFTKPPRTTPSIGNNTISFYSSKVLNRPVTVNPTPIQVNDTNQVKGNFVDNSKQYKAEIYLNRLLKNNDSKRYKPELKTSKSDLQIKSTQLFEGIKVNQYGFQNQESTSKSNPQLQKNFPQQIPQKESSAITSLISPQLNTKAASGVPHLQKLPASLLKKQTKISNDEISKYLTYRKKVNHSIIHNNNTSKLITNLNRINHAKSLENVKTQNDLAQFKSNSMINELMIKQPTLESCREKPESNFTSQVTSSFILI